MRVTRGGGSAEHGAVRQVGPFLHGKAQRRWGFRQQLHCKEGCSIKAVEEGAEVSHNGWRETRGLQRGWTNEKGEGAGRLSGTIRHIQAPVQSGLVWPQTQCRQTLSPYLLTRSPLLSLAPCATPPWLQTDPPERHLKRTRPTTLPNRRKRQGGWGGGGQHFPRAPKHGEHVFQCAAGTRVS